MFSGRFATVNGIGNVISWQVTEAVDEDQIRNSATHGGTSRIFCGRDFTGTIVAHGGIPPVMPGESFSFVGYTSPTTGVYGTNGLRYSGTAMCTQLVVTWDFNTNKAVQYTLTFGGMGALSSADGAAILDATDTVKQCSRGCVFEYGAGPTELLPNRVSATLTITSAVTVRSDASTNGWKTREAGPLDWTLAVVTNGHSKFFDPGDYLEDLKIAVNETPDSFWFNDAIVGQCTDITLTADGSSIDTQTVNIHMSACDDAGVLGFIREPGETVTNFWPLEA